MEKRKEENDEKWGENDKVKEENEKLKNIRGKTTEKS